MQIGQELFQPEGPGGGKGYAEAKTGGSPYPIFYPISI